MKKLISILLCVSVLFSCCAVFGSAAVVYGDLDDDKNITASDARLALRSAVKLQTLSADQVKAADVDANGKVDAADARMILRGAVKLEETKYFGLDGSQIFNGGHYTLVTYIPEKDLTLTISKTEESYYVQALLDFATILEIDKPEAKPVDVGFLTVESGMHIVLPSDNMYLQMDPNAGGSLDFSEIFEGLGSFQQGGEHTVPNKIGKVTENGKTYTTKRFNGKDGTYSVHLLDGGTLCYIRSYNADDSLSSQMQIKSITGTVSAAHRTTEGGKVLDGSKEGAMMMFMLTLVARTGLTLEDLGINDK